MNVLIIEDEKPAAEQLMRLLRKELPNAFFHGPLPSVKVSREWLDQNPAPDLIFLDIQLADGPSFEIFNGLKITAPIIFCTAYDQYALKAFQLNSIDYLLKPVEPEELRRALEKFSHWNATDDHQKYDAQILKQLLESRENHYKTRFVIKVGDKLNVIEVPEIDFFVSSGKYTFLQTSSGRQYPVEQSLDRLQEILDPSQFHRINRRYIIRFPAIEEVRSYSTSRLKLQLRNCDDNDVMVSRNRTNGFKEWLDS